MLRLTVEPMLAQPQETVPGSGGVLPGDPVFEAESIEASW